MADLTHHTLQQNEEQKREAFELFLRKLVVHRNVAVSYARIARHDKEDEEFEKDINNWGQKLLEAAWTVCDFKDETCPTLTAYTDIGIQDPEDQQPEDEQLSPLLTAVILFQLAKTNEYSSHTRALFLSLGSVDERAIVMTLKNPDLALAEAQQQTKEVCQEHSSRKTLRFIGLGAAAITGGVLLGVTGGLAAPLVGAGTSAALGFFGIGGPVGLALSGIMGSGVICGTLFGAYGASSAFQMIERHTRDVNDLALLPVRKPDSKDGDTLAIKLCVSGWLSSKKDVTEPWNIFAGDDIYALQWEVEALEDLATAVSDLIKYEIMASIRTGIIKQTAFSTLFSALAPMMLLRLGKILDNPWMNAKALAKKTGLVLGEVLAKRAFGNRPVTLSGFFLGSMVIFEALLYLASLPPSQGSHIVQDVYLFGSPVTSSSDQWALIRRVVSGRVINVYSESDTVLAVACRLSSAEWNIAGLRPIEVKGVENVKVDVGYSEWKSTIGDCLAKCGVAGLDMEEVERQRATEAEKKRAAAAAAEENFKQLKNNYERRQKEKEMRERGELVDEKIIEKPVEVSADEKFQQMRLKVEQRKKERASKEKSPAMAS